MVGAFSNGDLQVRVGIDLTSVEQVAESIARFGDRYLQRVYTPHELGACQGEPDVVASSLAARFAAKEATLKVLRPTDVRPDWRCIEVVSQAGGWCELRLSGSAATFADDAGIRQLSVSLSHEGPLASAVVVAICGGGEE